MCAMRPSKLVKTMGGKSYGSCWFLSTFSGIFGLRGCPQRLWRCPWPTLCPKGGFLTPLWGPRVGLERSLGTCRAHCLTILWHFCCACSTWRAFAGVWGAIWRPKGLKVRSVRLAGCAETIVNTVVFATCHLSQHICVVLFATWVSRLALPNFKPLLAHVGAFLACLGALVAHMAVYGRF